MFLYAQEKGIFGAIIAVFSYLYNVVNEMIIVLAILMLFDWITGAIVAKKENRYNKDKGSWGAVKKLFYIIIIVTGYLADISINYFATKIGLDFNTYGALGFAIIFYLVGNEGISVYTNLSRLGLPVPEFLLNIFTNIKALAKTLVKSKDISKEEELINGNKKYEDK